MPNILTPLRVGIGAAVVLALAVAAWAAGLTTPGGTVALPGEAPPAAPTATPTPQTTGEDFPAIWREINAFEAFLYSKPNPDLVDVIYTEDCFCNRVLRDQLEEMRARDRRYVWDGDEVIDVEVRDQPAPDEVVLAVTLRLGARQLVQDGAVIDERPAGPPFVRVVRLERGPDERWRMARLLAVEPGAGASP
ncbi:MAG: hypothetical protein M3N57_01675 [Actinomycetota bacterium]|nr:hypothetical protein [Actinomycetota bacterium]